MLWAEINISYAFMHLHCYIVIQNSFSLVIWADSHPCPPPFKKNKEKKKEIHVLPPLQVNPPEKMCSQQESLKLASGYCKCRDKCRRKMVKCYFMQARFRLSLFFLNTEQSFAGLESSTFTILINTASNLPTLQSLKPGDFRKKALKNWKFGKNTLEILRRPSPSKQLIQKTL